MSSLELALIPTLVLILPPLRQAPTTAIPLPVLAVDWEQIKKFKSILRAKYIEIYSYCKE